MIPAGLILAILGLGVMLPDAIGSVVLGGLPLLTGLYIFAKGAGIDDNVNRVMQEMRENADAAMFTSLLWTATLFSALFAVAEGWRQYELLTETAAASASVWLETLHSALAWIVLAFLTSTAGFMMLRIKRGNFSGRMIILSIFGLVVYSFVDSSLTIASEVLAGEFTFEVQSILSELTMPMIWIVVLWFAMVVNRSLKERQPYNTRTAACERFRLHRWGWQTLAEFHRCDLTLHIATRHSSRHGRNARRSAQHLPTDLLRFSFGRWPPPAPPASAMGALPKPGERFYDVIILVLGLWCLGGLLIDAFAHIGGRVDDTFFTEWHAVWYSGATAYGATSSTRSCPKGASEKCCAAPLACSATSHPSIALACGASSSSSSRALVT